MNLIEYDISHPIAATVVASERITPDNSDVEVRHLVLELPGDGEFDYLEGQSIGVLAPGPHEFGNRNHLRLYSIAGSRGEGTHPRTVDICVRRCFYIDDVSGEQYPGKASNFLCDAQPGEKIEITGPYGSHFALPTDTSSNLLMVGVGTGIAPFRAFVQHIHKVHGGWQGKARLYYGAKRGTELLYMNERNKDFTLYYDEKSFQAFEAVSPRPAFDVPPPIDQLMLDHSNEIWEMVQDPKTYVYVAGLIGAAEKFEKAMVVMAGSAEAWESKRAELRQAGRYSELLY